MKVLLDIDGTIYAYVPPALRLLNAEFGKTYTPADVTDPWPTLTYGMTREESVRWWNRNEHPIYGPGHPLPGAAEGVRRLHAAGCEFWVVTARSRSARAVTEDWLDRHGFPRAGVVYEAYDKAAVATELGLRLAVEDDPENAAALAAAMPVIVVDQPYNRGLGGTNLWRARDWGEVVAHFHTLARRPA